MVSLCLVPKACSIIRCLSFSGEPVRRKAGVLVDAFLVPVVVVLFFSTLVRSTFGFGDALISMPLLSLFLPIQTVAPLVAFVSITTSILIVARDWRAVDWRSAGHLIFSAAFGIPLGLFWLKRADESLVKLLLAATILSFSLFSLSSPKGFVLKTDRSIWLFGFWSGVFGGAYNAFGPPLVIYGTLRQWSPEQFRATIQGYVLPIGAFMITGHFLAGFDPVVLQYYVVGAGFLVVAVWLGRKIHSRFQGPAFRRSIFFLLILVGSLLATQAVLSRAPVLQDKHFPIP